MSWYVLSRLWIGSYKRPLDGNRRKKLPSGDSRFLLSLCEWAYTIYPRSYNYKYNVLSASLNKPFPFSLTPALGGSSSVGKGLARGAHVAISNHLFLTGCFAVLNNVRDRIDPIRAVLSGGKCIQKTACHIQRAVVTCKTTCVNNYHV